MSFCETIYSSESMSISDAVGSGDQEAMLEYFDNALLEMMEQQAASFKEMNETIDEAYREMVDEAGQPKKNEVSVEEVEQRRALSSPQKGRGKMDKMDCGRSGKGSISGSKPVKGTNNIA